MKGKLAASLAVFALWILITLLGPKLQLGSRTLPLSDLVSQGVALWLAAACVFLFAVVALLGWRRQVGLRAPAPGSWRLTWFPFLLILIFLGLASVKGFPPLQFVLFVLVNTLFVGISEELMTRGVLLHGVLSRFGIWPAIVIVSLLFGAMHLGNGFITGDTGAAGVQAMAAAMSGLMFMALRLRSGSLVPGIVVHWLWDFAVFMSIGVATAASSPQGPELSTTMKVVAPLLMATPSFLYGLWLLRRIGRRDKAELLGEPGPPAGRAAATSPRR